MFHAGVMKRSALLLTIVALSACGPEPAVPEAELGEVCGAEGPFRVLELEPDEVINYGRPQRLADRIYYTVYKRGVTEPGSTFPELIDPTIWATGPCGESPVKVATGVVGLGQFDVWPDVPLGCDDATGQIVALDPAGVAAPHDIFPHAPADGSCGLQRTPHGLISIEPHDDDFGAVVLHPYPADPRSETSTPVVLLDPIRLRPAHEASGSADVFGAFDEFVLALTPDDAMVRVDLADRTVTTLREHVWAFTASLSTGRYVLWQDATITAADDTRAPEGKIYLRDQADGSDAFLHETSLSHSIFPLIWAEQGHVELGLGSINRDPKRVFFLPELDSVDVPADLFLNARIDAERWIGGSLWDDKFSLVNLRTGETRPLFPRDAELVDRDDDALIVAEVPGCCDESTYRGEGPLWRVPFDGSEPQMIAERVTDKVRRLADGRYVTARDVDDQWIGTIALIDPDTRTEVQIDDHVFSFSLHTFRFADDGLLTYAVSDGERSGVYVAKLPPGGASARSHVSRPGREWFDRDLARGRSPAPARRPRPTAE